MDQAHQFLHREHIARLDGPLHHLPILNRLGGSAFRSFKIPTLHARQALWILEIKKLQATEEVISLADRAIFGHGHRTLLRINRDRTAITHDLQTMPGDECVFVVELELAIPCVKVFAISTLDLKETRAIDRDVGRFLSLLNLAGRKIDTGRPHGQPPRVLSRALLGVVVGFDLIVRLDREVGFLKTSDF